MKFKCGLTKEEAEQKRLEIIEDRETWKTKFAWLPVQIEPGVCVWWEDYEIRELLVDPNYPIRYPFAWITQRRLKEVS